MQQQQDGDINDSPNRVPLNRASSSQRKPKGILKNANSTSQSTPPQHLQWDEQNIALTEIQKDSLMKITEPKTPYVRYNPLTDEVEGDIPSFNLDSHSNASPSYHTSPIQTQFPTDDVPRDGSEQGSRRPSISGRSGSGSSSRSTSFSLPPETIGREFRGAYVDGEVEFEEEMDEEAAKKHADFVKARGKHYSNEGEAMKRAAMLLAEENDNDKEDGNMEEDIPPLPTMNDKHPRVNGVA